MANSIDLGVICLGAAIGYGLRNELKSAGSVCKNALLAAATVAAATTAAAVEGAQRLSLLSLRGRLSRVSLIEKNRVKILK